MKKIIYILILFPLFLKSQEYPRIDTLNYGENVWLVKHFSQPVNGSEEIFYKHYFNKLGKHVSTLYGYNSERQSKTKYEYNKHGQLSIIARLEFSSPMNDSLQQAFNLDLMQEYRLKDSTGKEIDWDGLYKKYEQLYEKVLPESVNWKNKAKTTSKIIIKHDLMGRDSIMELYSDISNKNLALDEKIEFYYNQENKLELKRYIDIPHANVFSFQAFKPNSAEIEDTIKNLDGTKKEIKYSYGKNYRKLDFFVNGIQTGYKEETWNRRKTQKTEIVFNMVNDTLSHELEIFNKSGKLIEWKRIKQTGYTGWGYTIDYTVINKAIYQYSAESRLQQIEEFDNEKHLYTNRFEIIYQ